MLLITKPSTTKWTYTGNSFNMTSCRQARLRVVTLLGRVLTRAERDLCLAGQDTVYGHLHGDWPQLQHVLRQAIHCTGNTYHAYLQVRVQWNQGIHTFHDQLWQDTVPHLLGKCPFTFTLPVPVLSKIKIKMTMISIAQRSLWLKRLSALKEIFYSKENWIHIEKVSARRRKDTRRIASPKDTQRKSVRKQVKFQTSLKRRWRIGVPDLEKHNAS